MKVLVNKYVTIEAQNYRSDRYLLLVDQFSRNRNPVLKDAKILRVSTKPQNLGFSYIIYYILSNSLVCSVEVYFDTYSQNYTLVYFKYLNFDTDFDTASLASDDIQKILKAISSKTSIALIDGQYATQNIEAKEFMEGWLVKIQITINGAEYQAVIYYNTVTSETNLILWSLKIAGDGC